MVKLPSQTKLNSYYERQFSYSDGLKNEVVIRKRSQMILKQLKHLAPNSKTICDVGSGYGFFLDEAQYRRYDVFGIEPSQVLASHGIKKYKLSIFIGNLKEYIFGKPKQFDIVTCIHVIEHVSNPKEFITLLLKLVKPNGILFLETPNSDSHLLYTEKDQYTFLIPPDHLWLFSRYSIQKMLPQRMQIVKINTYSYSEHFMGIFKQILNRQNSLSKNTSMFRNINKKNSELDKKSSFLIQLRKKLFYYFFDKGLAPIFTVLLNQYHKGSILELYIKNKLVKSGL